MLITSILLRIKRAIKRLLKVQSESRLTITDTARSRATKAAMLAAVALAVGILYPGEELYDPFDVPRRGEVAPADVVAPFAITVGKTEREIEDEEEMVRLAVPFVVDYDSTAVRQALGGLHRFLAAADSVSRLSRWQARVDEIADTLEARYARLTRSAILDALGRGNLRDVETRLRRIYEEDIYRVGVLPSKNSIPESRNKNVLIRRGERENIHHRDKLLFLEMADAQLLSTLNRLAATEPIDVEFHYLVGRAFLQPNLHVNMAEYTRRLDEELTQIQTVKETVEEGAVVVRAGSRVNERQERILRQLVQMQRARAAEQSWLLNLVPAIARVILVLGAFSTLFLFLFHFRREVFYSNERLIAILTVYAIQLFLIYLLDRWNLSVYLYPVAFLPIVLTILFDAEVGVLSAIVLAVLVGIVHRFDFTLTFMTVVAGTVAVFSARRVRRRAHFFRIMIYTAFAYAVFILFVENLKLAPSTEIPALMAYGLANGFACVILAIGILPVFESVFGITTDITLLELSDLNHPLLKRLALEAPGTYHHSIIVGNLSEAAAEAIGGNSLLARVGAYYHDIGKMEIPEYFVENQLSVKSKHESLSPSMSALILSSHVKKGRALGEAADIPDDVLNFIEEHHGTMVQKYFYDKALRAGNGEAVMDKFRYPGPKPQTRETGIAMLADAVEAASRTLDHPSPARIDNLIQRIINDRFESGELDQCPLTLRDLAKIKRAFAQVLIAAFHHRVEYPKDEKAEERV
ncbi:MAG TPA: HDIG domain-containing protein [candidate division Zixibacteria bacterium]|nr:HDIG domain-containing protein [candidate division Zixibacteria bacterium]MDD4916933.1 HDIG domain-containing protein [candidate division Zixibacteria bacterium]MDM7973068.1 HDIG domain-containing protein [candidate division Zixibacteria bacterium]HOD66814.1 HDIG domain-containing protein [candidate division Zixibacteria bacterium]HPM36360.1 HDIG domain-containing protein [candidate division Zixibacteria bacterium]